MSREAMQVVAETLDGFFNGDRKPKRVGFCLLVFPADQPEGERVNYVSNCDRQDMIVALKEIVARLEGRGHDAPEMRQ